MTPESIAGYLSGHFGDVHPKSSWGETSFFVNPGGRLPSGSYFATLKEKDGDNDRASNLDREGVFRLTFGPGKGEFEKVFGPPPGRPGKGGVIEGPWDFAALDQLMPHPVYGWMGWMCVLNPARQTFERIKPLLARAHQRALASAQRKLERTQ